MKSGILMFLFLLCLAVPAYCAAQEIEEPPLVTMNLTQSASYAAGNSYSMELLLSIQEGYHINSAEPESPELIPTRLTLSGAQGITLEKCIFPPVSHHKIAGEEKAWAVWNGEVVFTPIVKIVDKVKPGQYQLVFALFYQACDDQICQMPTTQELSFIIEVTEK